MLCAADRALAWLALCRLSIVLALSDQAMARRTIQQPARAAAAAAVRRTSQWPAARPWAAPRAASLPTQQRLRRYSPSVCAAGPLVPTASRLAAFPVHAAALAALAFPFSQHDSIAAAPRPASLVHIPWMHCGQQAMALSQGAHPAPKHLLPAENFVAWLLKRGFPVT